MQKTTDRSGTANDTTFKYTYNNNDQLTGETRHADLTGTVTANQTTTYTWTGTQQTNEAVVTTSVSTVTQSMVYGLTGQLAQVTTETKNGSGTVTARTRVDYRYDTSGVRFIAIDSTDSNLATTTFDSAAAGRTEYQIDHYNFTGYGQTIIETKYNTSNQATERTSYTFGMDEITQTVSTLNPTTGAVTGTPVTSVFAHDGHGSVRALLGASAALSQVFIYSAYGEMLGIYSTAGVKQAVPATGGYESIAQTRLLYNGEGIDSRTGLYNFRARWYSSSSARFERLDPFEGNPEDPFSFNKYGFVHSDPVMGVDPSGNFMAYYGMLQAAFSAAMNSRDSVDAGDFVVNFFQNFGQALLDDAYSSLPVIGTMTDIYQLGLGALALFGKVIDLTGSIGAGGGGESGAEGALKFPPKPGLVKGSGFKLSKYYSKIRSNTPVDSLKRNVKGKDDYIPLIGKAQVTSGAHDATVSQLAQRIGKRPNAELVSMNLALRTILRDYKNKVSDPWIKGLTGATINIKVDYAGAAKTIDRYTPDIVSIEKDTINIIEVASKTQLTAKSLAQPKYLQYLEEVARVGGNSGLKVNILVVDTAGNYLKHYGTKFRLPQ